MWGPQQTRRDTYRPLQAWSFVGQLCMCSKWALPARVCVCVCVCDAQIFQIMLKLRGSTMMRRNHESFCPSALSPGLRNWVEMTRNMQQEGVGLVLLPRPASLVRSPVLPCVEAPLGESDVP